MVLNNIADIFVLCVIFMRPLVFIITSLLYSLVCFGQNDSTKYYFPEIGLTVYVPSDFKLQEPKPAPQWNITDSIIIKQLTKDEPKVLLAIESLDKENSLEIKLIPITEAYVQFMGDSSQDSETSKEMLIAYAQQAGVKFDTLFTKIKIGNLIFEKMFIISNIRGSNYYDGAYSTKIGNYYLSFSMFFEKGKKGDELINMVETAKFN